MTLEKFLKVLSASNFGLTTDAQKSDFSMELYGMESQGFS